MYYGWTSGINPHREVKPRVFACTCKSWDLFHYGCTCGAFKSEQAAKSVEEQHVDEDDGA